MTNTLWKSAFRCLLQLSRWSDVAASIRCGKNLLFTESILAKLVSSLSFCMAWYHPTFWIMPTWTQTLINFEGTSDFDHPAQHFSSTSWAAALLSWKQRFSKITCISSGSCGLKTIWASQCTNKAMRSQKQLSKQTQPGSITVQIDSNTHPPTLPVLPRPAAAWQSILPRDPLLFC